MNLELTQLVRKYEGLRINDLRRRSQVVESLVTHGQQVPVVVVREDRGSDRYVLVDGCLRVAALEALSRDQVEAVSWEMSEPHALVLSHRLNNAQKRTALEEGWLLQELVCGHGLGREELSILLGRSRSWISRRLSLVACLPESVQRKVKQGRLGAHVAMKYLVPLARANAGDCERLVERLSGEKVSVRQMHRLYLAWRGGDAEQRKRVVDHPRLFLQSIAEESKEEAYDSPLALLLRDLAIIASVASRAGKWSEDPSCRCSSQRDQRRLRSRLGTARRSFAELASQLGEEILDAGFGHPDRDLRAPS